MNKATLLLLIAVIGVVGYVAAGLFIAIEQIQHAIETNDSESLADKVDFPTLRTNFKEQLNTLMMAELASDMEGNPFAALGMAFATKLIDGMVDTFVTPSGLANLMAGEGPSVEGEDKNNQTESKPFEGARFTYDSMSKFSAWMPSDDGEQIRFVFSRNDLTWKLSNIVLPQSLFEKDQGHAVASTDTRSRPQAKPEKTPSKPSIIKASLKTKSYREADYMNGVQEAITIAVNFQNTTDQDIRAFDGTLRFTDLLGNSILAASVAINDPISKNSLLEWNGELGYNQFMDSHQKFRNAKTGNIKVTFEIEKVLYQDGETQEF